MSFDLWRNSNNPISSANRAVSAWNLIQRNPASVQLKRGSTLLDAQTVRVELSNAQIERKGESSAMVALRDAVVFGVRNHPNDDVLDTDIKRDDLFEYDNVDYRVMDVLNVPGGFQAQCEAIS